MDTVTVTCLNCGGTIKLLEDAKGNVGACENCGMAETMTKTRASEIEKNREAGVPSGGMAPALDEAEAGRVRAIPRPDAEVEGAPPASGPDTTPTTENAPVAPGDTEGAGAA